MHSMRGILAIISLVAALLLGGGTVTAAPVTAVPGSYYVVQPGDSLSAIAYHTYGSVGAWDCIWRANSWIGNASYIQAGWTLWLPGSCAEGGGPSAAAGSTYVVRAGDSLSSIALMVYGNAGDWGCIWDANRWIGGPGYILPGWRLMLPGSCASGGGGYSVGLYHTVTTTETLSGIACMYYYDCNYWRIYNANPSKIWNVNYILPGTVLYIP